MPRDSYRAERATRVLQALGSKAARPRPAAKVRRANCWKCGANVWLARLPSSVLAPFDSDPSGDLVIKDGVAILKGPQHAGLDAFRLHSHKEKT